MPTVIPLEMEPMLAAVGSDLPEGPLWEYEPKWDGFRTLVHRSGTGAELISRGGRPLTRYFPELQPALRALPAGCVLDGEVVIATAGELDFDALLQRIHPADSRVLQLSAATPASYIAFDLLAEGEEDLRLRPLAQRRDRLRQVLEGAVAPLHLTPHTGDREVGREWFRRFEGAGLDGVIAKRSDEPYLPGRRAWVKVKHERTCDCVVIGYRRSSDGRSLGSLLLGLHRAGGDLEYVGHTSSFSAAERRELLARLEPLRLDSGWTAPAGRSPGGPSRWSRGRDTGWQSLRPDLVCEVAYDKLQSGQRFRHATRFLRWRPDRDPSQCGFEQIEVTARVDLEDVLGARG